MICALIRSCLAQRLSLCATSNRLAAGHNAAISSNSGSSVTRQNFFGDFIPRYFLRDGWTLAVHVNKLNHVVRISAVALALFFLSVLSGSAQTYSINWYKISGGGGTSSSGQYSLNGTIAQADASSLMTGGNYSLTGGFWAIVSVVQSPGAPTLYISYSGNTVTVYWQNVSGWSLYAN